MKNSISYYDFHLYKTFNQQQESVDFHVLTKYQAPKDFKNVIYAELAYLWFF